MQLTTHFSLEELTLSSYAQRKGLPNDPQPGVIENLKITAAGMEVVRTILGDAPIHVDSGYRSPLVNAAIGGAKNSAHLTGYACDFICPAFGTPYQVANAIAHAVPPLRFDQLILEYGWVHISFAPTFRMALLTKKSAEAPYEEGLLA